MRLSLFLMWDPVKYPGNYYYYYCVVSHTVPPSPQIQQGLVVYVCFFHGATEDVTNDMGELLLHVSRLTVANNQKMVIAA